MSRTRRKYNSENWRRKAERATNSMSLFGYWYHPYKVQKISYQNEERKYHWQKRKEREERWYWELEIRNALIKGP